MKVLIYGAGAIGRGFLATILNKHADVELNFVDVDKRLIDIMRSRESYKVAIINGTKYKMVDIPFSDCFLLGEEPDIERYDVVFCCVGPNYKRLAGRFTNARVVISLENDRFSAFELRKLSKNNNIYFGVPDVITSNTAPKELLIQDELTCVTEAGMLIIEEGKYLLPEQILQLKKTEFNIHWICKLFLHNAPHAFLAYLGWLKGYNYIHEAIADSSIKEVVEGSINEITRGLIAANYVPIDFAEIYKIKELKRFRNELLHDPISRVARNPLLKLERDNRIILGLRLAAFYNEQPKYTAIGVKAALFYNDPINKESFELQRLIRVFGINEFLKMHCGLEMLDPLNNFVTKQDIADFAI